MDSAGAHALFVVDEIDKIQTENRRLRQRVESLEAILTDAQEELRIVRERRARWRARYETTQPLDLAFYRQEVAKAAGRFRMARRTIEQLKGANAGLTRRFQDEIDDWRQLCRELNTKHFKDEHFLVRWMLLWTAARRISR